jgi:hypothetical protein
MARRVFVHIGTMKSATSYVQELFDGNRDLVLSQGVLWTEAAEYFLATDDLLGTRRVRPGLDGAWSRLDEALRAHPGDALISNELLAVINPRKQLQLLQALEPAEVSIVVTARDLGRVVPSQWQTGARNRDTVTWRDYVRAVCDESDPESAAGFWRRQDVPAIVRRWSRHVPLDRITVVTVPPPGADPSVLARRFGSVVGVDVSSFEPPTEGNPSVGGHSAELLRRVNERTADFEWVRYRWAVKNGLARNTLAERAPKEPPIRLTQAQLDQLTRRAQQMVSELAQTGVRVVGDLDDLVPAAATAGEVIDPGASSADELLDSALDGLVGLGGQLADIRNEQEALVEEVEQLVPEAPGDRETYLASEGEDLGLSAQVAASRYLRWRLRRRAARPDRELED